MKHKGVTEQSLIGNNADMKFYFRRLVCTGMKGGGSVCGGIFVGVVLPEKIDTGKN